MIDDDNDVAIFKAFASALFFGAVIWATTMAIGYVIVELFIGGPNV